MALLSVSFENKITRKRIQSNLQIRNDFVSKEEAAADPERSDVCVEETGIGQSLVRPVVHHRPVASARQRRILKNRH